MARKITQRRMSRQSNNSGMISKASTLSKGYESLYCIIASWLIMSSDECRYMSMGGSTTSVDFAFMSDKPTTLYINQLPAISAESDSDAPYLPMSQSGKFPFD